MRENAFDAPTRARMHAEESALMASLKKLDARRATRRAAATPTRDSIVRESKLLASIARLDDALKRHQAHDNTEASAAASATWARLAPKPRSMCVRLERQYEQFCRRLLERAI